MQSFVAVQSIIRKGQRIELDTILDVILAANPHLHDRIARFRSTGVWWTGVRAIVADSAGEIESVALTFRREIWTPDGVKKLAGIGAVATLPESRGRGLASATLEGVERMLADEGFSSAYLFCTIVPFYERLGWRCIPMPAIHWPDAEELAAGYESRNLDIETFWPVMADVYEQAGSGAILRPPKLWQESASWRREDPRLTLGAFEDGKLVAYVRGRKNSQGWEMIEATAIPGHERALGGLVREQMRIAQSGHVPTRDVRLMTKSLDPAQPKPDTLVPSGPQAPWEPCVWWPIDFF